MNTKKTKDVVDLKTIERWLKDGNWRVRQAAMIACTGRDVPLDIIERGLKDSDWDVRQAAMNACTGRDVPLDIIERWLKDGDWHVRTAAMNACAGRDIPIDIIERGLKDGDCDVRTAAMNACAGRDIPIDIIERGLKDGDWHVRTAAMNALVDRNMVTRTIEPPERVYKKCLGDVIVVAEIPKDAHIRGSIGQKCRASKAKIVDIIGDFAGTKIGISLYDGETCYSIGDEVEIDDFDMSINKCSTGFHFFCTKEEAENYN